MFGSYPRKLQLLDPHDCMKISSFSKKYTPKRWDLWGTETVRDIRQQWEKLPNTQPMGISVSQNLSIFNGLNKAFQLARLETRPIRYVLYEHHIEKLVPSAQITVFPFISIPTRVKSMKYINQHYEKSPCVEAPLTSKPCLCLLSSQDKTEGIAAEAHCRHTVNIFDIFQST